MPTECETASEWPRRGRERLKSSGVISYQPAHRRGDASAVKWLSPGAPALTVCRLPATRRRILGITAGAPPPLLFILPPVYKPAGPVRFSPKSEQNFFKAECPGPT